MENMNNNLVTPNLSEVQLTTEVVVMALGQANLYCRNNGTRSSIDDVTKAMCYAAAYASEDTIRTYLENAKVLHAKLLAVRAMLVILDNTTEAFKIEMQCIPLAATIAEWEEYMQYSSESGKLYSSMDAIWKQAVTDRTSLYTDILKFLGEL